MFNAWVAKVAKTKRLMLVANKIFLRWQNLQMAGAFSTWYLWLCVAKKKNFRWRGLSAPGICG
jgi:hypothetical protein